MVVLGLQSWLGDWMSRLWTAASAIAVAGTLAACALPAAQPQPGAEVITYETSPGPFCGRCDALKLIVSSDGQMKIERGHWAGSYKDWRTVRTRRRISAIEFERFKARLAPYRPVGDLRLDQVPPCGGMTSDLASYHITWSGGGAANASLVFDNGCDFQARAAERTAIATAPEILGVRGKP